ncbi:MAG: hypothetical protein IPL28_04340 [Chloroflexi bacterium]|nr:hypothetical protein [Chloroflexota bacterium]
MSLLVQFLIVSILPLCFVGMAVYVVRVQPVAKRIGGGGFWGCWPWPHGRAIY